MSPAYILSPQFFYLVFHIEVSAKLWLSFNWREDGFDMFLKLEQNGFALKMKT
jgi:hypothetical protein